MYSAIILEPRPHPAFLIVLDNFLNRLDERWNFIIFCGNTNINFLINLINNNFNNHKHRITLIKLNINNLNRKRYDEIFTSELFYNYIPTEMFLVFQLDTLISDVYYNNIYNFMNYDYVGAPWIDGVGNGGLSLRRKSKMLEILKNKIYTTGSNEDAYFITYENINKPSIEEAKNFSVETVFYDKSFGVHNPWHYISYVNIHIIKNHIPKLIELCIILFGKTHPDFNNIPNIEEVDDNAFKEDKINIVFFVYNDNTISFSKLHNNITQYIIS